MALNGKCALDTGYKQGPSTSPAAAAGEWSPRSPPPPVANPPVHTAAWPCHMQHGCPSTPSATLVENREGFPEAQVSCHSVNNPVTAIIAVLIYCLPNLNSIRLFCPGRKHWTALLSRKLALDHRTVSYFVLDKTLTWQATAWCWQRVFQSMGKHGSIINH